MADQRFADVAEVVTDLERAYVYEHGWQSWSPAGLYPALATSPRPRRPMWQMNSYRPERPPPERGFQSEGLLAVLSADAPVRLWAAPDPTRAVPSVRANAQDGRIVVSADGPVEELSHDGSLDEALAGWAETVAARERLPARRTLEPAWCSWYAYWAQVTEADVLTNLAAVDRLELPVGVVQLDDGYAAEHGDWLELNERFTSFRGLADRIRATGRRAGIWTAPFQVGSRSRIAREHPDWLVGETLAGPGWEQQVHILDVTHPEAAEHLTGVYRTLAADGFDYFKLDFLYAGAMVGRRHEDIDPIAAYRRGLELVRAGAGPDAVLLGCGAPLLPSIGLVDAMRVSPDIDPSFEPVEGDISQPGMRSALTMGRARAWQHGRFWVNDPDCLIVRPEVARRELWAEHIEAYGALAASSDPLDALDERGLELTRRLLRPSSPGPVSWDPFAGPEQGAIGHERTASRR